MRELLPLSFLLDISRPSLPAQGVLTDPWSREALFELWSALKMSALSSPGRSRKQLSTCQMLPSPSKNSWATLFVAMLKSSAFDLLPWPCHPSSAQFPLFLAWLFSFALVLMTSCRPLVFRSCETKLNPSTSKKAECFCATQSTLWPSERFSKLFHCCRNASTHLDTLPECFLLDRHGDFLQRHGFFMDFQSPCELS